MSSHREMALGEGKIHISGWPTNDTETFGKAGGVRRGPWEEKFILVKTQR